MRNLKRALSLLLSSTMVLGMVVMGGSAAGYQDVDASNDNQEAIEVLQAVGIMSGVDDKGNFNPDGSLTRNEMAVVMAHLLNLDYDYYRGVNTFSDVPEWAAPYVAACVAEGVTAGIGNGLYGGDQKITAAQAGLMVMKALGYFQNQEDFGSDWQVATIRQASYIDLYNNVNSNAESALTRGQVAQLVLNGLKAKMVDFTGDKGIQIGDVTVGYNAEYTARTSAASKYDTIDDGTTTILVDNGQYFVQLGEELYNGNLKLSSDEADVFGRPARVWSYNGEEIGTYVNYDLMVKEYTTSVTGKEMYDAIGKTAFDKYEFSGYVDGKENDLYKEISNNNKDSVSETGNGALTQVFVDSDAKSVVVTVVNTYLAEADTDYNEKKEEATFTVHGLNKTLDVSAEDFDIADVAEGDFALVTYSYESEEIETIADVKTLSEVTISKFTSNDVGNNSGSDVSSVTVDGTKYNSSNTLTYDVDVLENYTNSNLKDKTYNVYLDQYGYAIGVEEVSAPNTYLFLTGINGGTDYLATANYEANVIFMDGNSEVIKVKNNADIRAAIGAADGRALVNQWFKFTKGSNDVYTLTAITEDMTIGTHSVGQYQTLKGTVSEIDNRNISLKAEINNVVSNVYGNEDTVYLVAGLDTVTVTGEGTFGVITEADEVITGVDNVDAEVWDATDVRSELKLGAGDAVSEGVYALYDDDGVVIAAVVVGESAGISSNVVYVNSSKASEESYADGTWTWTREVILNGELVTLTEVNDADESVLADEMAQYSWYTVKYDADGNVKKATIYDASTESGKYAKSLTAAVPMLRTEDLVILDIDGVGVNYNKNGRTIYDWNDKTDDNGVVVNSDVKFVIRQINKNKTTTEEYTGWNQLVSALETLNVNRDYDFNAVIENGRISSVVIIDWTGDDYEGPDGTIKGNVPTNFAGSSANVSNMSIAANGVMRATFTYNAPAQIADGDMDFDVLVYVDGAYYTTLNYTDQALVDGKLSLTYISSVLDFFGVNAADVSFEIANEKFDNVKVRYYDVDNKVYLDSSDFVSSTDATLVGAKGKLPFRLKTNSTDIITFAVKQGDKQLGTNAPAGKAANLAVSGVTATSAYTADDYVVVEITGLGSLTPVYTVTGVNNTIKNLYGTTGNAVIDALTVNIQPANSGLVTKGNNVAWSTVNVAAPTAGDDVGAKITFNTGDTIVVIDNGSAVTTGISALYNVTADFELEITNVEVVPAAEIESAVFFDKDADNTLSDGDQIIVTFDQDLDTATAPAASISGGSWATLTAAFQGDSKRVVVYTITTVDTTNAGTVTITGSGVKTVVDTGKNVVTNGNYTIAIPATADLDSTLTVTNP